MPNDVLLIYLLWKGTEDWREDARFSAMLSLSLWMLTTKWVKLIGHYIRYPVDVFFLPLSVLFGYCHGLLKLYAMFTLDVVSSIPAVAAIFFLLAILIEFCELFHELVAGGRDSFDNLKAVWPNSLSPLRNWASSHYSLQPGTSCTGQRF